MRSFGKSVQLAVRLHVRLIACGTVLFCANAFLLDGAGAQPIPTPQSTPSLRSSVGNIGVAAPSAIVDLGTNFLQKLGNEATVQWNGPPRSNNPAGGGADLGVPATASDPRYRTWFEGYGLSSRMDAEADYAGDRRKTWGGVAGIGMTVMPGMSAGLSVDQSRTKVDVTSLGQSATIDLTQIGGNLAFESGAWTLAIAGVGGFGNVDTSRPDPLAPSLASYDATIWGTLAELSYLISSGNWRVVPKAGADWAYVHADAFTETGGTAPVSAQDQTTRRARIFAGVEVGHSWFGDQSIFDLAAYGRLVQIVAQDISAVQFSAAGFTPVAVQGVAESRTGLDAGAAASLQLSQALRLYAVYDGRFLSNFQSHGGTIGLELRW
jgi:outer membrane autotransporter protein